MRKPWSHARDRAGALLFPFPKHVVAQREKHPVTTRRCRPLPRLRRGYAPAYGGSGGCCLPHGLLEVAFTGLGETAELRLGKRCSTRTRSTVIKARVCEWFATCCYTGHLPLAPGTWASVLTCVILYLVPSFNHPAVIVLLTVLGYFCHRAGERRRGRPRLYRDRRADRHACRHGRP